LIACERAALYANLMEIGIGESEQAWECSRGEEIPTVDSALFAPPFLLEEQDECLLNIKNDSMGTPTQGRLQNADFQDR
jgi:hypothetical protein